MREGITYRSFHEGGTDMFSRLGGVWWVGERELERNSQRLSSNKSHRSALLTVLLYVILPCDHALLVDCP